MKLRRQLGLLALIGLLIPGLTLYALRVFNEQAKNSQLQGLANTAHAIAARLGSDTRLLSTAELIGQPQIPAEREMYSHNISAAIVIDGDSSEWQTLEAASLTLPSADSLDAQYRAVTDAHRLYLSIAVADSQRRYHQAGSAQLASGDHLIIYSETPHGLGRYTAVRAELPGPTQAVYRNALGGITPEEQITGVWRETPTGYRIELALSLAMTEGSFALAVIDKTSGEPPRMAGTLPPTALIAGGADPGILPASQGRIVTPSSPLNDALTVFLKAGTRLTMVDNHGWLRAQAGELSIDEARASVIQSLLSRISKTPGKVWQDQPSGLWPQAADASPATPHAEQRSWSRRAHSWVASVSVPVVNQHADALESRQVGRIVLEQTILPWQLIDAAAAKRLLISSLLGGGMILALLLGYASWLSTRIARLSHAASRAAGQQNLSDTLQRWPNFQINDEINALAQDYRAVLQQLQDHNDYLRTLTGKLSHELRTPLAVVTGSLDNLSESEPHSMAKYADRAREGSARLSAIISAMTEASRVEASIASAEKETVNLEQLLQDITQAYQSAYPGHTFKVSVLAAAANTYRVEVAPELLVQLLDKLVDNAVSFTTAGAPIELSLRHFNSESQGVLLELAVTNQGPALPANMRGRLFHSLTSERSANTGQGAHLGLGLYIVELITRFHGGEARAQDIQGGVKVAITLPAQYRHLTAQRGSTSVDNSP